MIEVVGQQTQLNFGKGDIHIISSGTCDGKIGYVAFENQNPPRNIGKNLEEFKDEFNPNFYPIVMSFSKVESIDVLINELINAKDNMIRLNQE